MRFGDYYEKTEKVVTVVDGSLIDMYHWFCIISVCVTNWICAEDIYGTDPEFFRGDVCRGDMCAVGKTESSKSN